MNPRLRVIPIYLVAVAFAVVLGTIIQTQFNLAALQALGADIGVLVRLRATGQDLLGFTPAYAAIVSLTLLLALPMAALLARLLPQWRLPLYFFAGGVGLLVAFQVANAVAPMPTLIAATRTAVGSAAMILSGAFGALLFATLMRPRS
ncbi:hypothetical protein [Stutzerimonas tarimensis]|uniref:MFS transporter n=1 Tax=Stutzerimonas tarimensis TaxID=1507735 RepID=A0ABV7T3X0_9GAMM